MVTRDVDPAAHVFEALFGPEFGHGKAFDLDRLRAALAALGYPQDHLPPVIHVAGTNGKGSTIAFLRAMAEAAGLRVHAFTKPHLFALRERFVLAGREVSDEALCAAAQRIARMAPALTHFDAQTAAAFVLFAETPADLVLLETGMGGLDDSTNVITGPALTVLTPIGLDHQDALGATLAEIAAHKAGIFKRGAPAISARQDAEAMAVIDAAAAAHNIPLWRQGVDWDAFAQNGRLIVQTETRMLDLPLPGLAGAHQADNAGLAAAALLAAGFGFDDNAFARGVRDARWPGRLQPLRHGDLADAARSGGAEIWVDGGHNVHAAHALARWLEAQQKLRPASTALIIAMRARKDWRVFVETLAPHTENVIALPLGPDGAAPDAIAAAAQACGVRAHVADTLESATGAALANGAGRILICGSFLLAAQALCA